MSAEPADILDFWFEGGPGIWRTKWFEKNADFDRACARFTPDIIAAREGAYDSWALKPRTALALIILLDQLPRNVFRGLAEAFTSDARALTVAETTVAREFDLGMTVFERVFVYLPFEHAETIEAQDQSVRRFEQLRESLGSASVDSAHRHRDVIRRFGRFPHRNEALGRVSTPEEVAYLAEPGAGF